MINKIHVKYFLILGISPGWFIEHVVVTNEVTGHFYR